MNNPENEKHRRLSSGDSEATEANSFAERIVQQAGQSKGYVGDELEALGRYRIQGEIGSGGFGTVVVGEDPQLDRRVAIKCLRSERQNSSGVDFVLEARRLAQLRHPGIVSVFDIIEQGNDTFIVMEFVDGTCLSDALRDSRPSWQQSVEITAGIAEALAHAHATGIIHRDIKPGNVILRPDGKPVVLDFGLGLAEADDFTGYGMVQGSPSYMSPEQIEGKAHRIDGRTDIYALGVVLYEMLAGRRPFTANNSRELLRRVLSDEPQPVRQVAHDIPVALGEICHQAMAKNMADRFTTAADLANALRRILPDVSAPWQVKKVPPAIQPLNEETSLLLSSPMESTNHSSRRLRGAEKRRVVLAVFNFDATGLLKTNTKVAPDLEELHDMAADFGRLVTGQVQEFGGIVLPSSGDEIIACFGYPVAYEDAAHRAIRSACHFRDDVMEAWKSRVHAAFEGDLQWWAVIHSGEVIVDDSALESQGFSVTGEARNVAVRLEAVAEVETISISADAHQLVTGFFECESLGTQRIRGLATPPEMFRVSREAARRNRVELTDPANLTTLVGRDTELSILKDRWERALERMGQVVTLVGEAGLGKSRLIREIREYVIDESEGERLGIVELRCSPQHTGNGFFPIYEFLHRLLDLESATDPEEQLGRLVKNLQDLKLSPATHLVPFAALMNVPIPEKTAEPTEPLSPQRLKELTGEFLVAWLRAFSDLHPVLFIFEDMHWVDPSSLELMTRYVEQYARERVLFVITFRPEFVAPWRDFSHQTRIALNRLTRRQVRLMLKDTLSHSELVDRVVDQVIERTDGVPLFIEEFSKLLADADIDADQDIASQLAQIPATLQDLLIARLERMDADPQVVQMAAAIGREFDFRLLQRVVSTKQEELTSELEGLVAAELIFQQGDLPNARFIFKHALIQDAAYNSLLKKTRQEYHSRIVDALTDESADEASPSLLAHHATAAGRTTEAIAFRLRAGENAKLKYENAEAIEHFEAGLQLIGKEAESQERDGTELQFQANLGVSLIQCRGYSAEEVGTALQRARELALSLGATDELFFITWGIWALRLCRDEMAQAMEMANNLYEIASESGNNALLTEAYFTRSISHFFRGEFAESLEASLRGQELVEPEAAKACAAQTGQDVRVTLLCYESLSRHYLGYPELALQKMEDAIRVAEEVQHPFTKGYCLHHAGWLYYQNRLAEKGMRVGKEGQALCEEQVFPFFAALCKISVGTAMMVQGSHQEAIGLIRETLETFLATGASMSLCHYQGNLAWLHLQLGQSAEAIQQIGAGIGRLESSSNRFFEAELYRLKALALYDESPREAMSWLDKSASVAEQQQARAWSLRTATTRVELLSRDAQDISAETVATAKQKLQEAYDSFTEGAELPDLKDAKQLLQ